MDNPELLDVVQRLAVVFSRRQVRHALIGGLAVGLRGRPRATKDADFILHVPALAFSSLLEELVADGFEIDVMDFIRRWSVDRFAVFYRGHSRIDWMQPVLPLYANVMDAAEPMRWLDADLRVATAEGLILTKMVAFRPQDRVDIETLLIVNREKIDLELIRQEWSSVAIGEESRTAWLEGAIARSAENRI